VEDYDELRKRRLFADISRRRNIGFGVLKYLGQEREVWAVSLVNV
jgi:hypothetical protein